MIGFPELRDWNLGRDALNYSHSVLIAAMILERNNSAWDALRRRTVRAANAPLAQSLLNDRPYFRRMCVVRTVWNLIATPLFGLYDQD
jgi:hypothetical protein